MHWSLCLEQQKRPPRTDLPRLAVLLALLAAAVVTPTAKGFQTGSTVSAGVFRKPADPAPRLPRNAFSPRAPQSKLHAVSRSKTAQSVLKKNGKVGDTASIVRGKVYSVISKFFIAPKEAVRIARQVAEYMQWTECMLIATWVLAPVPVARWIFFRRLVMAERRRLEQATNLHHVDGDTNSVNSTSAIVKRSDATAVPFAGVDEDKMEALFRTSTTRKIALFLRQIGLLQAILYSIDVSVLTLKLLGFQVFKQHPVQRYLATIVVSFWVARNLSVAKWHYIMHNSNTLSKLIKRRYGLTRQFGGGRVNKPVSKKNVIGHSGLSEEFMPEKLGFSNRLLNRAMDVIIYACAVLAIIDILPFQMGIAVKSLFGLSSVGTLVFSLASRDVASQCLASLAIEGSNLFEEGDEVLLYDGTRGLVTKMGWLHTHIRRGDEMTIRIPNSQIANNRVANVSRTKLCQVQQSIAIRYEDIDKIGKLAEDIRECIRERCGKLLIDNGARPFRVNWKEYQLYYIEIVVDAHFRHRPSGTGYWELRESVLYAIHDATKKNGVQFSYTNFIGSDTPLIASSGGL